MMNTDGELLAEALLGVITWIKSTGTEPAPLIVGEMIYYGRALYTFLFCLFVGILAMGLRYAFPTFKAASGYEYQNTKKWVPQAIMSVSSILIGIVGLVCFTVKFIQVWFAPRLYLIDALTQIILDKT